MLRRDLRRRLTEPVPGLSGSVRSLADIGITTGAWGTPDQDRMVLDGEKLQAQLEQDPDAVAALLQGDDGVATRGYEVVSRYTGSTGLADSKQQFYRRAIDDIQRRIDRFDQKLVDRERLLRRQFTALEQALRSLQSQGTALEAQLGQLMKTTS